MAASLTGPLRVLNQSRLSGVALRVSRGVMPPQDALHCGIENSRAAEGVTGDEVLQADPQRRRGWTEERGALGEILDFGSDRLAQAVIWSFSRSRARFFSAYVTICCSNSGVSPMNRNIL